MSKGVAMNFGALVQQLADAIKGVEHALVASLFGILNMLVRPVKEKKWLYFVEFFLSTTVATFVGIICNELEVSPGFSYTLVAVSALLARDILSVIIGFGSFVSSNQETLFDRLWKTILDKLSNKPKT